MKFYNTLTNKVEEFEEIVKGKIGFYTCGPTVYDFAHIGNFRSYLFEDLVKRYFLYRGYNVLHVMNITDIDDKTIKKAIELKISLQEVTQQYIDGFYKDIEILNILKADVYPKATEHINEMVGIIEKLEDKGYAYIRDNSVYFRIESFAQYGKLANISKEGLKTGLRVDSDEYEKENIQDCGQTEFVLYRCRIDRQW